MVERDFELSLEAWININNGLRQLTGLPYRAYIGFRFARIIHALSDTLLAYDTKRNDLVEEYGSTDVEGNLTVDRKKEPDKYRAFTKEHTALLQEKVALKIRPLRLSDLMEQSPIPSMMTLLFPIIEDDVGDDDPDKEAKDDDAES